MWGRVWIMAAPNVTACLYETYESFLVSGGDVLSDMPWKQIKKLWTCPVGLRILFWLKWISIKEVTRSENSTSPACKGLGTLGTPSLICFKPKRQIIVLIWQAANSHVPSSRMHSVSNVELPAPKNEKAFEWGSVGSGVEKPWGIRDKLQVWNAISVCTISPSAVQIFN